ncbi:MAG TPA: ABC transporter substrate-binding protein [Clostridiaceae bacterium]|nr:ABC transporter substrate-binding protein [Clostridiaceae bacterium]
MKLKKVNSLLIVLLSLAILIAGCGKAKEETSDSDSASDSKTEKAEKTEKADEADKAEEDAAVNLNDKTLDEIIAAAKEEGDIQSVGMPDNWANWGNAWQALNDEYGITHTDLDMSSSEELQIFKTEGKNGTKDIGDVGQAFGAQVIEEDLVQGYKTSYWDNVPDWAKGEDGKWMMAYTGSTTFLVNTDLVDEVPKSWEDIRNGDYKVSIGDISGATAQAGIIASNFAFGGTLDNLDPGFEFWTEMGEAGRINTIDITQQNFETGEVAVGVIWSFNAVAYKNNIEQYKMEHTIPTDGAILSGYASIINKYAPHPNAAALAREYFFSDEGQANLAAAGAIPTRTDVEIPQEIQDATFQQSEYANAIPMEDTEAYTAACEAAVERWNEEITPLIIQ